MRSAWITKNSYSLVEVLTAIGMLITFSVAVTALSVAALRSAILAKHRLQAAFIAQEQLEIMHNIRDTNLSEDGTSPFNTMMYAKDECKAPLEAACGVNICCSANQDAPIKNVTVYFHTARDRYYTSLYNKVEDREKTLRIFESKGEDTITITYNTKIEFTHLTNITFDGLEYLAPPGTSIADEIKPHLYPRKVRVVVEWKEQTIGRGAGQKQQLIMEEILTNLKAPNPI